MSISIQGTTGNDGTPFVRYSAESLVKNAAYEVGFSLVGITDAKPSVRSDAAFDQWIGEGKHGEMRYLSGGADKRHDPATMLSGAKSVICVGVNYYSRAGEQVNRRASEEGRGVFSIYAHERDYHEVLKSMLLELGRRLKDFFPHMKSTVCVDTQPISERDLAIKSGIGWLGKNTCVISKEYGSWVFLGELITTLALDADEPLRTLCGSCTKCIDACPTAALEPFVLDARKCISYLTIEKRGDVPLEFHEKVGNHVFGCDICQQVCPFNKVARDSAVFDGRHRNALLDKNLEEIAELGDEEFLELTRYSAIRRAKAEGLRRNSRIALENKRGKRSARSPR